MNTRFDCRNFEDELPDLVLTPGARPSAAMQAHMAACVPCSDEYLSFQSTFAVLDHWTAPEPTAYFDQKLAVRLREEQAAPQMGWLERLAASLTLNSRHGSLRPMLAGAVALALAVGGGTLITRDYSSEAHPAPVAAAVNDLQILDRNEQAFQQMDMMQQDAAASADQAPAPVAVPES